MQINEGLNAIGFVGFTYDGVSTLRQYGCTNLSREDRMMYQSSEEHTMLIKKTLVGDFLPYIELDTGKKDSVEYGLSFLGPFSSSGVQANFPLSMRIVSNMDKFATVLEHIITSYVETNRLEYELGQDYLADMVELSPRRHKELYTSYKKLVKSYGGNISS